MRCDRCAQRVFLKDCQRRTFATTPIVAQQRFGAQRADACVGETGSETTTRTINKSSQQPQHRFGGANFAHLQQAGMCEKKNGTCNVVVLQQHDRRPNAQPRVERANLCRLDPFRHCIQRIKAHTTASRVPQFANCAIGNANSRTQSFATLPIG